MNQHPKPTNIRKEILSYLLLQRHATFHKGIQGIIVPPKKKKDDKHTK